MPHFHLPQEMLVTVLFSQPLSLELETDLLELYQSAFREGSLPKLGVDDWTAALHYYYL